MDAIEQIMYKKEEDDIDMSFTGMTYKGIHMDMERKIIQISHQLTSIKIMQHKWKKEL